METNTFNPAVQNQYQPKQQLQAQQPGAGAVPTGAPSDAEMQAFMDMLNGSNQSMTGTPVDQFGYPTVAGNAATYPQTTTAPAGGQDPFAATYTQTTTPPGSQFSYLA